MKYKNTLFFLVACLFALTGSSQKIRVACIGNSVTYGYGLSRPAENSYPAVLQKLLGASFEVKNFGHSGATLLRRGHNPYMNTREFREALAWKPDLAVIHLGLNDTDPRNWNAYRNYFLQDYSALIDSFRNANPRIQVMICKMTPIFHDHPRFRSGTRDWFAQIQEAIAEVGIANGVPVIDLHAPLYARPDLFEDALHPNEQGASIIARTVYGAITGDYGGLSISSVFADDMVLQRDVPIPIYGTANAGTMVRVTFSGRTKSAIAGLNGKWAVTFDALPAGGPYSLRVEAEGKILSFSDIQMGDVWLVMGQSNMEFPLKAADGGEAAAAAANGSVRLFRMSPLAETYDRAWDTGILRKVNDLEYFSGTWNRSNPASAANFSAVGYFFGDYLAKTTRTPIGLVQIAVGGAPLISFLDRHTLECDPVLVNQLYDPRRSDFLMPWVRQRARKNVEKGRQMLQRHPFDPSYIFEAGVSHFAQTPVKGLIWYQGESDAHNIELYRVNFSRLIAAWRRIWFPQLPVYFVQLSSIDRPSWPYFRDMQRKLADSIPHVGMAVSLDVGDSLDVHPAQKQPVGERLALLALKKTYGKKLIAAGPNPVDAVQKGKKITVSFSSAHSLTTKSAESVIGFEVMDQKGRIVTPAAKIKGNRIVLTLQTADPVRKVLYAFRPFTRANLINEAGLPASTFSIPVIPEKSRR